MIALFIGLGLIAYSNLYSLFLKMFTVKSTFSFAFIFALLGIVATSISVYFNFTTSSTGEIIVFLFCIGGAIVRIGYAHFMYVKIQ